MTTKHVTVQEHATSGLDEHQEPGRRDEVHKTVADGLVLVEVDAVVVGWHRPPFGRWVFKMPMARTPDGEAYHGKPDDVDLPRQA